MLKGSGMRVKEGELERQHEENREFVFFFVCVSVHRRRVLDKCAGKETNRRCVGKTKWEWVMEREGEWSRESI